MYAEDELLPLSALQHLLFCERQCALIHIERVWADNALTVEGSHLHRTVDEEGPRSETRHDVRITRGLALQCRRLGLVGRADVVEFHRSGSGDAGGVALAGLEGLWQPFPVEHKRGGPKRDLSDRVQLCAQALCLEEMLDVEISEGALFYGGRGRREVVEIDEALRSATETAARRLRELVEARRIPPAMRERKCERCSLLEKCLPEAMAEHRSANEYFRRWLADAAREVS